VRAVSDDATTAARNLLAVTKQDVIAIHCIPLHSLSFISVYEVRDQVTVAVIAQPICRATSMPLAMSRSAYNWVTSAVL
jgi:hypothetical protein